MGKIERGERVNLDEESLLCLADILKLTIGERREFFLAATGMGDERIFATPDDAQEILASVLQMLADIRLPALLVDRYLDVIAVNDTALKMYNLSQMSLHEQQDRIGVTNLLDFIFSSDFEPQRRLMAQQEWHRFAVGNIIYFRRVTLRYRMTNYFALLLAHLRRNRNFRRYWEQVFEEEKLYFIGGKFFQMHSPSGGHFHYLTAPLMTLPPHGNLEIIIHIPRQPTNGLSLP